MYQNISTTENYNHQKLQVNHPKYAKWQVDYYDSFLANFDGWKESKSKSLRAICCIPNGCSF